MDQKLVAGKQAIIGTFDRAATTYDRTGPRHFTYFGRRLVELCDIAPGSVVLDVATGRGAVLFPVAQQVGPHGRITGIDLSTEMVRETTADLQKAGLSNVDLRLMDGEDLTFSDNSFDWVLSGFSLWFFPRPDQALAEFFRVLRPGGRLGITTWDYDSLYPSGFVRIIQKYVPPQKNQAPAPMRFDTPQQLVPVLQSAGFSSIDIRVEEADLVFKDEEVLWSSLGTAGAKRFLELLGPLELKRLKAEILDTVRPAKKQDGVHVPFRALVAFGTRPG
jgi:ubiquinone/menaquinone biosynthesis C-methylase UbiE